MYGNNNEIKLLKMETEAEWYWQIQHTSAIGGWLFQGIIWIFCPQGIWSTFDPLTSVCGSVVFVAVHGQILSELHMLLFFDGTSFAGPRQSL